MDYPRVTVVDHPLVQHKLSLLRDKNTSSKQFRELVKELCIFEGYAATKDLELDEVEIETAVAKTTGKSIKGKKLAIVAILRAGIGMIDGMLELVPVAHVGFLGMFRDQTTHEPVEYYAKLPRDIDEREVIVVDPMLATGGTACKALSILRDRGVKKIKLIVIIAAPVGIERVLAADPDVEIYTCAIDQGLNENAYIVPGLGDAGDRIFETL